MEKAEVAVNTWVAVVSVMAIWLVTFWIVAAASV